MQSDVVVVGAGLVGLATAHALLTATPGLQLVVLEKEERPGQHQSGRNSGVLHAGVYYRPGSEKARLCTAGRTMMEALLAEAGIPFQRWGKVIVARSAAEVERLNELERRVTANGVETHRLGREGLRDVEPHAAGIDALHVPVTGTVDFGDVAEHLTERVIALGGEVRYGERVVGGGERGDAVTVETTTSTVMARSVVTCAGLHADRVARILGAEPSVELIPFRGEYAELAPSARHLVRGLIYPVPNPEFPFLGVHFTRTVDDRVEIGPSAAPAFSREGYTLGTADWDGVRSLARSPGFRRFGLRHWRMGLGEVARSVSMTAFWNAARTLVPGVARTDVRRVAAGVRAQAIYPDGSLADDFVIEQTRRAIHVINAPSPAATASLALGGEIAAKVQAMG